MKAESPAASQSSLDNLGSTGDWNNLNNPKKMSKPNFHSQKCILCYCPYDFNWNVGEFSAQLTPAVASSCLKHIPPDIHQTVDWNQLDAINCLRLCNTCEGNLRHLAKLNCELEEIQRKISELANCISLYVRNERGKYQPNLPPTDSEPDILHRNDTDRNPEKQYLSLDHCTLENQNSSSLSNDNDDVGVNDMEFTNLDDNSDGFQSDEEANQSKFPLNTNTNTQEELSKIQSKELKEQKKQQSYSQAKPQGPNYAGFECSTCHKKFSRYIILKKHDCEKPTVECETCGLSYSSSGVLKLHTRSHTGEKPYKCKLCDKAFSYKSNLSDHIDNVHTEEKMFECKICGKKVGCQTSLIKHKRTHTDEAMFKCEVCGKSYKFFKSLRLHLVTHSTGTSHPYKCDLCDKTFAVPSSLTLHKNRIHFGVKFADCEICGKTLLRKSAFISHMRFHSGEYPFQCSYCGKKFKGESGLKHHEKTHTDVGEFPCDICGKACHNSNSLKWHRRRYHQENKIQCEICGKQIFKASMRVHLLTHSDASIKCDICGKIFKSTNHLKLHQIIHLEENPFECSTCGQTFKSKDKLNRHVWKHKDLGEFTCDICQKTYKNPRLLKTHVAKAHVHQKSKITCNICGKIVSKHSFSAHQKTHPNLTHFKCDICGKKFTSNQGLINHITHFCHICNKYFFRKSNVSSLAGHQVKVHTVNSTFYPSDDESHSTNKQKRAPSKKKKTMTSKELKNNLFTRQLRVQITKLDMRAVTNSDNDKNDIQEITRKIVATRSCKGKSVTVNYNESSSEDEVKSENYSDDDESKDLQVKVEVKSENEFSDIDDS